MIKKKYKGLAKKYKLPSFDIVENELEISSIESDDFLLRKIRRKIAEKIEDTKTLIGSILQPSAESLVEMHECKFFSDTDKKKMIEIYKKLVVLNRLELEAGIEKRDMKDAEFINDFFKEWANLKNDVLYFIRKMKASWEKETEIEEKLEYFG